MKIERDRDYLTEDIILAELKECNTQNGEYDAEKLEDSVHKLIQAKSQTSSPTISFPQEIQEMFKQLEDNGNPWGLHWGERDLWADGLEVPVAKDQSNVDVLFWVGCAGSFKQRSQDIARAMLAIFREAKVNFAILGVEEQCCGAFAKEVGNEHLFQALASENIATLNNYQIKTIVTNCPHCHHILKDEYPKLGGDFEVIHHSQYIAKLLKEDRVRLKTPIANEAVYHDPCFLGGCSQLYQEPRVVLQAIPGLKLKPLTQSAQKSFCCGGGGTRRITEESCDHRRLQQILAADAELITTACPFCVNLFEQGARRQEQAKMMVEDIAEVVIKAF